MVITRDYLLQQIEALAERLAEARSLVRQAQVAKAGSILEELLQACEALREDGESEALDRLEAEIRSELALFAGARGDVALSVQHLDRALAIAKPLFAEAADDPAFVGLYTSLQLNAGAVYAATGRHEEAIDLLTQVADRLKPGTAGLDPSQPLLQMRVAALQNRAMAKERLGQGQEAVSDCFEARVAASELEEPVKTVTLVDLSLRLASLQRKTGQKQGALDACRHALDAAEAAVHEDSTRFHGVYMRSKIAVADACFENALLAEGEDHIFEAIERMPDLLDTVLVAMDFYSALLLMDDEVLEEGGLPREEVEESFGELLAKLDVRSSDSELSALAHARFRVLTGEPDKSARALLKKTYDRGQQDRWRVVLQARLKDALATVESVRKGKEQR